MKINGHRWRLGAGLLAGAVIVGTCLLFSVAQRLGGTGKGYLFPVSRTREFIRITSASSERVSFQRDIYPIFEKSCFFCHGPKRHIAGFRADRLSDFFRNDGKGALVLPGNSGESRLVAIVSGAIKMKRRAHPRAGIEKAVTRIPCTQNDVLVWLGARTGRPGVEDSDNG